MANPLALIGLLGILALSGGAASAQTPPTRAELSAYHGLHTAAAQGSADDIRRLAEMGADPNTRTELWEYTVDNARQDLKAGAFAYAQLGLQRDGLSLLVPPSAVSTTQEKKFVIRVKNNVMEWVDVSQGIGTDKGIEVFGRLQAGDTLLVKATDERKPGSTAVWKVQH